MSPPCIDAKQIRAALAGAQVQVRVLAAEAGVSTNTITRAMRGENVRAKALGKIKNALEQHGLHFVADGVVFRLTLAAGMELARRSLEQNQRETIEAISRRLRGG